MTELRKEFETWVMKHCNKAAHHSYTAASFTLTVQGDIYTIEPYRIPQKFIGVPL